MDAYDSPISLSLSLSVSQQAGWFHPSTGRLKTQDRKPQDQVIPEDRQEAEQMLR